MTKSFFELETMIDCYGNKVRIWEIGGYRYIREIYYASCYRYDYIFLFYNMNSIESCGSLEKILDKIHEDNVKNLVR